jgi:hypothetical protein
MITIDPSQRKTLHFGLSFTGRMSNALEPYFRIYFENYQVGFKARVTEDFKAIVDLPPLSNYLKNIEDSHKTYATLEVVNDRDIFLAWRDDIKFKNIIKIEAIVENNVIETNVSASVEKEIEFIETTSDFNKKTIPQKTKPTLGRIDLNKVTENIKVISLDEIQKNKVSRLVETLKDIKVSSNEKELTEARKKAKDKMDQYDNKIEKERTAEKIVEAFKKS